MTAKHFTLACVAAALAACTTSPALAADVKPCALLKSAEVQAVASAPIGEGVASVLEPTATHACEYKWTVKSFSPSLEVLVTPRRRRTR